MAEHQSDESEQDPPGGHTPEALEKAAERMKAGDASSAAGADGEGTDDPEGGHDEAALKEAAQRMGTER